MVVYWLFVVSLRESKSTQYRYPSMPSKLKFQLLPSKTGMVFTKLNWSMMIYLWLLILIALTGSLLAYRVNPSINRGICSLNCVEYSRTIAPSSYIDVEKACISSLAMALNSNDRQLLSLNVLTPGLNPKLEQKAMLLQENLYDLIVSILPTLQLQFTHIKIMFQSIGDAASFNKYHNIGSSGVVLTDVDIRRMNSNDDCVLFITTKNHVGDPVIDTVKKIVDTYTNVTCIFLNCDLSDKVSITHSYNYWNLNY